MYSKPIPEIISQLEFLNDMITQATTAKRPIDHDIDETRSIQSTITEKMNTQKLNRNNSAGFQPQTQSTPLNLNPNINNTETTESISPTEKSLEPQFQPVLLWYKVLQYHCKFPQKPFEASLIFIMNQTHLKSLYLKITLLE